MSAGKVWTEEAVRALGIRTDVPTAGEIIAGWHRDDAYDAVKRGEFPVPVHKGRPTFRRPRRADPRAPSRQGTGGCPPGR